MKTIHYTLGLLLIGCLAMSFRSTDWVSTTAEAPGSAVTVNGYAVVGDAVMINSRGRLAVVEGDPRSANRKAVPFRLLLKRQAMVIQRWPETNEQTNYSMQLDDVWPVAQPGDQLLIEPVGQANKQLIRLIKVQTINWLPLLRSGDGC